MNSPLSLPEQWPEDFTYTDAQGLTDEEAASLLRSGHGNTMPDDGGKPFRRILFDNFFTLFNFLNFALAICLLLVGSYKNMLFLTIILTNILIGTVQEYRAQQTIRKMKLLSAPEVHVLRGGREIAVRPEEAVRGDLVIFRSGDQVAADAVVVRGSGSAMEALLTGESDPVPKQVNSWLYSGSYITEGKLTAQLVYVSEESYVGRLTREARKTARPVSPLMTELNRLIRFDSMVLVPLGVLLFLKQVFLNHLPVAQAVPSSVAAMIGMIPEGLILLTSIAMAVGVMKLARKKALVQELAGIETLARADVLCLDKTGTITSGQMNVRLIEEMDMPMEEIRAALSRFLGAFDDKSQTLDALRKEVPAGTEAPVAVLPFTSKRKKSGATFRDGTALVLGAPEYVLESVPETLQARIRELTAEGLRVLILASGKGIVDPDAMPAMTKVCALLALEDQIRPGAEDTLRYFREQGVDIKVISGDDPQTVSRIARRAGLLNWDSAVDARKLATDAQISEACRKYTVFGRVTPEQKKQIVAALKADGHNVAMTGDGVNDIPALKSADCSIAMAGGADAARHAAQLTLLDSDFSVMPEIVLEGRRVINNITRAASLFLTKTIFSFLLSILMLALPGMYPFQPIQLTLISSLTVGIPGFFLALEPSGERVRGRFLKTVLLRALPGGVAVALCSALAMAHSYFHWDLAVCSTMSTLTAGYISFLVLLRTCVPLSRHRIVLVVCCVAAFIAAVLIAGGVFSLVPLNGTAVVSVLMLCVLGAVILFETAILCPAV